VLEVDFISGEGGREAVSPWELASSLATPLGPVGHGRTRGKTMGWK